MCEKEQKGIVCGVGGSFPFLVMIPVGLPVCSIFKVIVSLVYLGLGAIERV